MLQNLQLPRLTCMTHADAYCARQQQQRNLRMRELKVPQHFMLRRAEGEGQQQRQR
jgi:hypothetical protein